MPSLPTLSERVESPLGLTREQFKKSCAANSAAASHTTTDKTGELLAKVSNKQLAMHISKEVRSAYKAGAGSSNKDYEALEDFGRRKMAAIDARQRSFADLFQTNQTLNALRAKNEQARKSGALFISPTTLKVDAANCGELARAAAKRTLAYGGHAEVWKFLKQNHAFVVIGQPPEKSTVDFKTWKGVWIVDPWANIVCEAADYVQVINKKMKKWANAGKVILEGKPLSPIQPDWIWSLKFGEKAQCEAPSPSMKNPWQHDAFSIGERPAVDLDSVVPLPPIKEHGLFSSLKSTLSGLFTGKAS